MKVLKKTWFTQGIYVMCVVLGEDEVTKKKKAYIAVVSGLDEKTDINYVCSHGAHFPVDAAEILPCS